jgi:hypothetical protein
MAGSHYFERVSVRLGVIANAAEASPVVFCQKLLRTERTKQHAAAGKQSRVQEIATANRLI